MATPDPRVVDDIRQSLAALHVKVDALTAEIGVPIPPASERGKRESIRDRMHKVESSEKAIESLVGALNSGLGDVTTIVSEIKEERDRSRIVQIELARRFSTWKTRALFAFAGLAALGSLKGLFGGFF